MMTSRTPPDWDPNNPPPPEEWTQRPTKRKRLLKACSQCHKSKRRCDGFGPCQNCEFAGKQCVYLDTSGREISPPHGRHPITERLPSSLPSSSHPMESTRRGPSGSIAANIVLSPPESLNSATPSTWSDSSVTSLRAPIDRSASLVTREDLGIDAVLCRDLVNIFFSKGFPYNNIFHRPSFLNDLANGLIPHYLLHAIFALAAPLSNSPTIRRPPGLSPYDEPPPPWKLGDRFAQASLNALRSISRAEDGEIRAEDHPGHELELAQTLLCLSLNESTVRRKNKLPHHHEILHSSLRILIDLEAHDWGLGEEEPTATGYGQSLPGHLGSSSRRNTSWSSSSPTGTYASDDAHREKKKQRYIWSRREAYRRTLWVSQFAHMLATAICVLPMCFRDLDVRLPLPVNDGAFDLMEPEDTIPAPNHLADTQRMYISELGHLIRVAAVYARVIGFVACIRDARQKAFDAGEDYGSCSFRDTFLFCRDHLERWRRSLPNELQFNEANIIIQLSNFDSGISHSGFLYAFMHALAQCAILSLYAALEVNLDYDAVEEFAPLRRRAHDTLLNILERLGPRGRFSICLASLLVHVGGHGLPLDELSVMRAINDPRARPLLEEYEMNWGVAPYDLLNTQFRTKWIKPVLSINAYSSPDSVNGPPLSGSVSPTALTTNGLTQHGCFSSCDENKHVACRTRFTRRKVRYVSLENGQRPTGPQFFLPSYEPELTLPGNAASAPRGSRPSDTFSNLTLPPIRNASSANITPAPPPSTLHEPFRQLHPLPVPGPTLPISTPRPFDNSTRDFRPPNHTLPSLVRPVPTSEPFPSSGTSPVAHQGPNLGHAYEHPHQQRQPSGPPRMPWPGAPSSGSSAASSSATRARAPSSFDDRHFQGRG
ncbi:uncharacterized protein EI90DRAFT_1408373 [Cantharellus anzutake]|uniref:uncharacterized protein n=1 Tax=Cantharellus anzutake TaxID=1750568 RepID=UPI001907F351|nr:uncharacterized protein EI90DRAFT_1408373 [Cantharellus anzutake]KAF8329529.1 hypothetical protein EI90DRAFT_1408373 [Cantharellus anzutake]